MSTKTATKLFDLTSVIELNKSLSTYPIPGNDGVDESGQRPFPTDTNENLSIDENHIAPTKLGLGNFDKLFRALGPVTATTIDPATFITHDDYASDGVTYGKLSSKGNKSVKWHEDVTEGETTDPGGHSSLPDAHLPKWKRIVEAKKKQKGARKAVKRSNSHQGGTVSESEAGPVRRATTPASVAGAHLAGGRHSRGTANQGQYLCDQPASIEEAARRVQEKVRAIKAALTESPENGMQSTPVTKRAFELLPLVDRSDAQKEMDLLLKLGRHFPEDRETLWLPSLAGLNATDPKGVHVFVDASNIFIGFKDNLKRARNIRPEYHIPDSHVNLAFEALAVLLERKRPTAKRELVGSAPRLPAHDRARELEYETHILERVSKLKPLTEREKHFKTAQYGAAYVERLETTPRVTEQGVDELLQLKMVQSIVDCEPSIMVLATGDAQKAEYGDGFLDQVKRALKKGWQIELVSWRLNISGLYKDLARQPEWQGTFRIIYLDDYAEDMLRKQT